MGGAGALKHVRGQDDRGSGGGRQADLPGVPAELRQPTRHRDRARPAARPGRSGHGVLLAVPGRRAAPPSTRALRSTSEEPNASAPAWGCSVRRSASQHGAHTPSRTIGRSRQREHVTGRSSPPGDAASTRVERACTHAGRRRTGHHRRRVTSQPQSARCPAVVGDAATPTGNAHARRITRTRLLSDPVFRVLKVNGQRARDFAA